MIGRNFRNSYNSDLMCAQKEQAFMQKPDIYNLTEQAKRRDPEAFTQLIQLYTRDLYKTAIAILRNDEDAADAIQETILICWEKLQTLKKPDYFRTWLTRILINKCYEIRNQHTGIVGLEEWEEPVVYDTDNLELREAIASLGETYSIIMILYYGLGFRTKEIAEMLGISPGAVRVRLKRGRQKLKEYYNMDQEGDLHHES